MMPIILVLALVAGCFVTVFTSTANAAPISVNVTTFAELHAELDSAAENSAIAVDIHPEFLAKL